jgi:hypothetical protein
MTMVC